MYRSIFQKIGYVTKNTRVVNSVKTIKVTNFSTSVIKPKKTTEDKLWTVYFSGFGLALAYHGCNNAIEKNDFSEKVTAMKV